MVWVSDRVASAFRQPREPLPLHDASIITQVLPRMFPAATGRILKPPGALIAHVGPQVSGSGAAAAGIQYRQGRVVGMQMNPTEHMAAHRLHQGTDQLMAGARTHCANTERSSSTPAKPYT